jgi:uncharacterized membrane protein YphA (DoxX/SURF4 family)
LRAAIGAIAISDGLAVVSSSDDGIVTIAAGAFGVLTGACLLAGFLTPIAGALAALGAIALALSKLPSPGADTLQDKSLVILVALVAAAVMLLGPGALSLDARLFGRREIIIPRMPRSPEA